jgi:hypothetical protein
MSFALECDLPEREAVFLCSWWFVDPQWPPRHYTVVCRVSRLLGLRSDLCRCRCHVPCFPGRRFPAWVVSILLLAVTVRFSKRFYLCTRISLLRCNFVYFVLGIGICGQVAVLSVSAFVTLNGCGVLCLPFEVLSCASPSVLHCSSFFGIFFVEHLFFFSVLLVGPSTTVLIYGLLRSLSLNDLLHASFKASLNSSTYFSIAISSLRREQSVIQVFSPVHVVLFAELHLHYLNNICLKFSYVP